MRVLFIVKKNETYGFKTYTKKSSGLWNSTRFIVEGLKARGVHAVLEEAIDGNCVDRLIHKHKPSVLIVEALWVTPDKFRELRKLHKNVRMFVHMHSGVPFLAQEGISMEWLREYPTHRCGVEIIANSLESYEAIKLIYDGPGADKFVHYLPNVYLGKPLRAVLPANDKHWHARHLVMRIACLGAIRPMKNHLTAALASLEFARQKGMYLEFAINATRTEVGGEAVLKNLRKLFVGRENAHLNELPWHEPEDIIRLLSEHYDMGMQPSLTETFNVVSADYVTAGLPVVVSKEVKWVSDFCKADESSVTDQVRIMHRVWRDRIFVKWNQHLLRCNSEAAQDKWFEFVHKFRY